MHVVTFEVENFRSVGARVVLSELGPLVVLHGENDTGKSNLLAALRATFELLGNPILHARRSLEEPQEIAAIPRFVPHRAHRDAETRLRVVTVAPDIDAELVVRTAPDRHVVWFGHLRVNGASVETPLTPETAGWLIQASRQFHLVDEQRHRPGGWDKALLDARDADTSGDAGRLVWRQVEAALRAFPGMANGRLDRVAGATASELAWEEPTGVIVPFSNRGSGLRAARDLLIAAALERASAVAIEEPELHLSEESQQRLRDALMKGARVLDQQLFLTSHTWAFDGAGPTWTVTLRDGETRVTQSASRPAPDSGGQLQAGWVNASGMLQLPASVRQALDGHKQLLHFSPDPQDPDLWLMLTDEAFRRKREPNA